MPWVFRTTILYLLLGTFAHSVAATPKPDKVALRLAIKAADQLVDQGRKLEAAKKFYEAAESYAKAYTLMQSPATLLRLGIALYRAGHARWGAEFCQRYSHLDENLDERQRATICRSAGIGDSQEGSLTVLRGIEQKLLVDLNLADIYLFLNDLEHSERFAEHFLTQVPLDCPGRHYAINLLRQVLKRQNKSDPYARASRPRLRVIAGALTMGVGVGLLAWGIGVLVPNGRCVGSDAEPMLPDSCQLIYSTLGYGAPLVAAGGLGVLAGVMTVAWPGRDSERALALSDSGSLPAAFSLRY